MDLLCVCCCSLITLVLFIPILEAEMLKEEFPIRRSEIELDAMRGPKEREEKELQDRIEAFKKSGGKIVKLAPSQKRTYRDW